MDSIGSLNIYRRDKLRMLPDSTEVLGADVNPFTSKSRKCHCQVELLKHEDVPRDTM